MNQERVLTGDRVTGKLHLGHYVGSLKNRVRLQERYETLILLADVQALTTHFEQPQLIRQNLREVALDYLASGIDPEKATLCVQSMIPEIAELTVMFSMFVTVNSLRHNPTIKSEAKEKGYVQMYYGFLGYPVSQAADIAVFKATLVPVGDDQLPHIEQARKIVRRFNELYRPKTLPEPNALVGEVPRLAGLDGHHKMSKSRGNAIHLDSSPQQVADKIKRAVTDPARIHKSDPGHPDICPIFAYHQAFRREGAEEIRRSCTRGRIGCTECKALVTRSVCETLEPMRERRERYAAKPHAVDEILMAGTAKARAIASETMAEVKEAMGIDYFRARR